MEIIGSFVLFFQLFFANVAGIGGGYFSVMIYYEMFHFEWIKSLSIAAFVNLITSIIRFIYHYKTRHPTKHHRTLIDYELVLCFLPLGLLGLMVGNLLYSILPMFVVAVLIGVFWSGVTLELFVRAIRKCRHIRDMVNQMKTIKIQRTEERFKGLSRHNSYTQLIDESKSQLGIIGFRT